MADEADAKYGWPPVGSSAEKQSFIWHALHRQNFHESPLSAFQRRVLVERATLEYASAAWSVPTYPFSDEAIIDTIGKLNMDGTPGPGLTQFGSTNEKVIEKLGVPRVVAMVRERLSSYLKGSLTPQDVRVFVKQEPTKLSKLKIGRQRLIWSFPMIDQIICALVFDPSLNAEIRCFTEIPTKVGMSTVYGGWDLVRRKFENRCEINRKSRIGKHVYLEADKSAWDWSVPAWALELERDCRWALCVNPKVNPEFKFVFDHAYWLLLNCRVIFSDGECCRQTVPGIMKSGHKLTISSNSRMQFIIKSLCTKQWINESLMCMGDDTIEDFTGDVNDYFQQWRELGFVINEEDINVSTSLDDLTFCSNDTAMFCGMKVPVLRNKLKSAYALRHCEYARYPTDQLAQFVDQLRWGYCFDDSFDLALSQLMQKLAPASWRPQWYYQNRVAGVESVPRLSGDSRTKEYALDAFRQKAGKNKEASNPGS